MSPMIGGPGVEQQLHSYCRSELFCSERGPLNRTQVTGSEHQTVGWYRQAADQGDAGSAAKLGKILLLGQGGDKNLDDAVKFLTLAADKGNAYAQFNLATLYASGTGVKCDLRKAYELFTRAGKTLDVSKQLDEISSQLEREDSTSQVSRLQQ